MRQHLRSWAKLKATKRSQRVINEMEGWVENVIPKIEMESAGLERPQKQLIFLFGDPTAYKMFQTPEEYKEIAKESVGKIDGYTEAEGDVEVRKELVKLMSTDKWTLQVDDVILTAGGTQSLFFACLSLAKKGDKILAPRPTYPVLYTFATYFGIEIVFYDLRPGDWNPDVNQLEYLYQTNPGIKFIMINTPSNPLGSVFSKESIFQIMSFCERYRLPIVSDEIYEEMVFKHNDFKFLSDYSDTVPIIRCSGLTKRCLVPGWRLGWIALFGKGNTFNLVKTALKQLANIFLMPNTICQVASTEVYKLSTDIMPEKMAEMERMYHLLVEGMKGAHGMTVGATSGALYATIILEIDKFEDIPDSITASKLLQQEENVQVFPGEMFYGKNFLRLVICQDVENIIEACIRFKRFALRHKKKE